METRTSTFNYNPEKRQLILISKTGRPVIGVAGPIAKIMYDKINQKDRQIMVLTEKQLDEKIAILNNWLLDHKETHLEYAKKKQSRDYYVNKLIELGETGVKTIRV